MKSTVKSHRPRRLRELSRPVFRTVRSAWLLFLITRGVIAPHAQKAALAKGGAEELAGMNIEQLMNESVTSVSKKEQKISQTAAAIYVITQEDIKRSGMNSLPELLRMVPGMQVAQMDANKWAISSRGFTSQFSNKLLVLVDGRSVYSPYFSGVFWDAQDQMLEDIDRIEVIRGPGASLWGANAVNGVINIITKSTRDTQGGLVTAVAGTELFGGALRYGGKLSDKASYRVYAKQSNNDDFVYANGADGPDERSLSQTGFRVDWAPNAPNEFTFQGDYYNGQVGYRQTTPLTAAPYSLSYDSKDMVSGGNVLSRWSHTLSETSDFSVQAYYDRAERRGGVVGLRVDTFDVDFQHRLELGTRNEVLWGGGYRHQMMENENTLQVAFNPTERQQDLLSAFVQDDFWVFPDKVRLTLGAKVEHNDYTGLEFQPNARLLWTPTKSQSVWLGTSHAVRTPARLDNDIAFRFASFPDGNGNTTVLGLTGNPDLKAEKLNAYELGYRIQPHERFFVDVSTFFNSYTRLIVTSAAPAMSGPPVIFQYDTFQNAMSGEVYGVEVNPTWNVSDIWKITGSYSFLEMNLHSSAVSALGKPEAIETNNPQHQFGLRSYLTLPLNLAFDSSIYYVGALENQNVPDYLRLDLRVGWQPSRSLEVSIGMQNLLDAHHPEFTSFTTQATEVERSYYAKLTWRF